MAGFVASKTILPCDSSFNENQRRVLIRRRTLNRRINSPEELYVSIVMGVDAFPPDLIDPVATCDLTIADAQGCHTIDAAMTLYFEQANNDDISYLEDIYHQRQEVTKRVFQELKNAMEEDKSTNPFLNDDLLNLHVLEEKQPETATIIGETIEEQVTNINQDKQDLPPDESLVLNTDTEERTFLSSQGSQNSESVVQYSFIAFFVGIALFCAFLAMTASRRRSLAVYEDEHSQTSDHQEDMFVNHNPREYRCSPPTIIDNGQEHEPHTYEHTYLQ
mmetsp:Transcript_23985/g.29455  ORF Transcript_23985/g.29455 Transcript_23985/m.29455 type:complete len:276 (+) Transcript_23985:35-862(+)